MMKNNLLIFLPVLLPSLYQLPPKQIRRCTLRVENRETEEGGGEGEAFTVFVQVIEGRNISLQDSFGPTSSHRAAVAVAAAAPAAASWFSPPALIKVTQHNTNKAAPSFPPFPSTSLCPSLSLAARQSRTTDVRTGRPTRCLASSPPTSSPSGANTLLAASAPPLQSDDTPSRTTRLPSSNHHQPADQREGADRPSPAASPSWYPPPTRRNMNSLPLFTEDDFVADTDEDEVEHRHVCPQIPLSHCCSGAPPSMIGARNTPAFLSHSTT